LQDTEFHALRAAFEAGVRVPEPYFLHDNVLFMELLVGADGTPAPRLADLHFSPEQATQVHLEVFLQVRHLLETGRVHADLSAYNILMAAQGPTLIDLPQVVDVARNANAGQILRRDLRNVTEHLARFDARLLRFADCGEALYGHCARGTLDQAVGPEERAPQSRRGGRRGRDAERGRAGREKSQHAEAPRFKPAGPPPAARREGQPGPGPRPRDDRRPSRRR
jgi:RIO kinase 1